MTVNVHDDNEKVIARVEYNTKLDNWDGNNFTAGSAGHHLGITKLRDGSFVLIHGSDWENEGSAGEIVSAETALDAILKSGNTAILKEKKFSALKELMDTKLIEEEPDETDEEPDEGEGDSSGFGLHTDLTLGENPDMLRQD